jgi:GTP-binding protein Era
VAAQGKKPAPTRTPDRPAAAGRKKDRREPSPRPVVAEEPRRPAPLPVVSLPAGAEDELGPDFRAGFVAIIGQPNVGKSTLLNLVLGEKLAIVSDKPQTTRVRLLGVKHVPGAQLALVDTPGLHRPSVHRQTLLNRYMVEEARAAASDVDALLLVIDASKFAEAHKKALAEEAADGEPPARTVRSGPPVIDPTDRFIVEQLAALKKPLVLAVNKVDRVKDKGLLLPLIEAWSALPGLSAIVPISAMKGSGVDRLLVELCRVLPASEPLFPDDMLTDAPERLLCAERIREQLYLQTQKELPYATAITIDSWEERISDRGHKAGERGVAVVSATIHVEKPNQKRIVIGEGGSRIREIGKAARVEIEALLGCAVHLELFVRVDEDWSRSRMGLREMGYTQQSAGRV